RATQAADDEPAVLVLQKLPQPQQRPEGDAGDIAGVLQVQDHLVQAIMRYRLEEFFLQASGAVLALDLVARDGQYQHTLLYAGVQVRVLLGHDRVQPARGQATFRPPQDTPARTL